VAAIAQRVQGIGPEARLRHPCNARPMANDLVVRAGLADEFAAKLARRSPTPGRLAARLSLLSTTRGAGACWVFPLPATSGQGPRRCARTTVAG